MERLWIASCAAALVLSLGCAGDETPHRLAASASPSIQASPTEGYSVSDERITKENLVDGAIRWAVTFDAVWTGDGEPEPQRCVFITYTADGERNHQAAATIDGPGDDVRLGELYPDEIAGVPVEVEIICGGR